MVTFADAAKLISGSSSRSPASLHSMAGAAESALETPAPSAQAAV